MPNQRNGGVEHDVRTGISAHQQESAPASEACGHSVRGRGRGGARRRRAGCGPGESGLGGRFRPERSGGGDAGVVRSGRRDDLVFGGGFELGRSAFGGAKADDDYEDFYDGSWDDEANDKNESGTDAHNTSQFANYPWTGCNHNGTESFFSGRARALGSTSTSSAFPKASVRVGQPNNSTVSNAGPLSSNTVNSHSNDRPLYGLSEVFQVSDPCDDRFRGWNWGSGQEARSQDSSQQCGALRRTGIGPYCPGTTPSKPISSPLTTWSTNPRREQTCER